MRERSIEDSSGGERWRDRSLQELLPAEGVEMTWWRLDFDPISLKAGVKVREPLGRRLSWGDLRMSLKFIADPSEHHSPRREKITRRSRWI